MKKTMLAVMMQLEHLTLDERILDIQFLLSKHFVLIYYCFGPMAPLF